MKPNLFLMYFHAKLIYVIRIALTTSVCVGQNIFKMQFLRIYLSRYQYVLNMAEALYYIANTLCA
jgi:hypothetical protein